MPHSPSFSSRVLDWFDQNGRKDLPWQRDINPYRVWVSEIMLQQTQVQTVIPYFERFKATFTTLQALDAAEQNQVLHLWNGLGYYARARNLHRAAIQVCEQFGGEFPGEVEALCELPGIGRSTAGAIVSIAFGRRAVILDGNVKRVLARYRAVQGWPGKTAVHRQLWDIADEYTPSRRSADFSQAMMDLGATLCTRSGPDCDRCPVSTECQGRAGGNLLDFPGRKPRKTLPVKTTTFLMVTAPNGDVWLEKRPSPGIWGGLWCFPEIASGEECSNWCLDRWGRVPASIEAWDSFRHTFSHYHLDVQPLRVSLQDTPEAVMEVGGQLWYNRRRSPEIGLAAPVASLLARLAR